MLLTERSTSYSYIATILVPDYQFGLLLQCLHACMHVAMQFNVEMMEKFVTSFILISCAATSHLVIVIANKTPIRSALAPAGN